MSILFEFKMINNYYAFYLMSIHLSFYILKKADLDTSTLQLIFSYLHWQGYLLEF